VLPAALRARDFPAGTPLYAFFHYGKAQRIGDNLGLVSLCCGFPAGDPGQNERAKGCTGARSIILDRVGP
jgi:hypothetical protein